MNKLIIALFLLSGCGGGDSDCADSPLIGSWIDELGFIYTFTSSCVFVVDACDLDGTYKHNTQGPLGGELEVEIKNSDQALCLDPGKYTCDYVVDDFEGEPYMAYNCGEGLIVGVKI